MSDRQVWTYYLTRDSENGRVDAKIDVWWKHPIRVDHGCCITWEPSDQNEPGWYQKYEPGVLRADGVTVPDTDRELIVAERWATEKVQAKMQTKPSTR